MIKARLNIALPDDEYTYVDLPGVPRKGDRIGSEYGTLLVMSVIWHANHEHITIDVEKL